MKIIEPSIQFLNMTENPLQAIEAAGRTCYKLESKITKDSAYAFVDMLLKRGHEAMIEHADMSYRVICDRGVSHEIVRHRLFSYAQESTRYVNYITGIEVIMPPDIKGTIAEVDWRNAMEICERSYAAMIRANIKPQIARSVLPTCLKTEIVIKGNFREWRHFFRLRTDPKAHPQMIEVAKLILHDAWHRVPLVFDTFDKVAEV